MKEYKKIKVMGVFNDSYRWLSSHVHVGLYFLPFILIMLASLLGFVLMMLTESVIAIILAFLLSISALIFSVLGMMAAGAMLTRHLTLKESMGFEYILPQIITGNYWSYFVFPILLTACIEIVQQILAILTATTVVFAVPYIIYAVAVMLLMPSFTAVFRVACLCCEDRRISHWLKLAWFHMKQVFMRYFGAMLLVGLLLMLALIVIVPLFLVGSVIGYVIGGILMLAVIVYFSIYVVVFESIFYERATKENPKIIDYAAKK